MQEKQNYFFRTRTSKNPPNHQEYGIQIPSLTDIQQMREMPAGAQEDQYQRLTHMVKKIGQIQAQNSALPIMTTDEVALPELWSNVFNAIREGDEVTALEYLGKIPVRDMLLQALLTTHSFEYLQKLVHYCIEARSSGTLDLENDVVITPGAFEVLIKDLATTLSHGAKLHFSFGLPSHHAFKNQGSGFCILDKTAILIKYMALANPALKFLVIGTDVNRDNGLGDDLITTAAHLSICHVDIFDSRVYPRQDHSFIQRKLGFAGEEIKEGINSWWHGNAQYLAVDLSLITRQNEEFHPALAFAIHQMEEHLVKAKKDKQEIMIFLPTGWDSHEDETAYCGKYITNRMMSKLEAQKQRFSDADMTRFYEKIFALYQDNKKSIAGIYWGLEGGYHRPMYEKQITLLMNLMLNTLINEDTSSLDAKHNQGFPGK
ncbi:acetylpolyamine aminohydrolase [Legionella rowbothamii]|uniref:acetylpolyamine aminohydrolase n=1 Tax=Legionella rowbothamii TaxID=96229 RepID=UPI0013EFA895|nr:acetylpolyamine aminohydrolase [Legionella rowbothamii]